MNDKHYLFVDVETTGLDPKKHGLLEVGAILVDGGLEPLADFQTYVKPRTKDYVWADGAIEMHKDTGFLDKWFEAEGMLPEVAVECLVSMLDGFGDHETLLAGRNVHFDRAFLEENHASDGIVEGVFSHRHLDERTLLETAKMAGVDIEVEPEEKHHAFSDAKASLETVRQAVEVLS